MLISQSSSSVWSECLCASFGRVPVFRGFRFARVQVCQGPVLPEYQFCVTACFSGPLVCQSTYQSARVQFAIFTSFARAPVFCQSTACVSTLPEFKFYQSIAVCQNASFARAPVFPFSSAPGFQNPIPHTVSKRTAYLF